jgi:hypothetical protein
METNFLKYFNFSTQTPEGLAQTSQNLVRRYEGLLVALDLFESNLVS